MKEHNKVLNYNTPGYFQLDGMYNASSDDPAFRQHALTAMKEQIDYASEAGCSLIVLTGTPAQGDSRRPVLLERYSEFFLKCAAHAAQYNMTVSIEPIERGRFKNLILGPTWECAAFIKDMQEKGASNAKLILDIAHLPLMGEDIGGAVKSCMELVPAKWKCTMTANRISVNANVSAAVPACGSVRMVRRSSKIKKRISIWINVLAADVVSVPVRWTR